MPKWYCLIDGRIKGPISKETILDLAKSSQITPATLAWTKSMEKWRPIIEIDFFKELLFNEVSDRTVHNDREHNYVSNKPANDVNVDRTNNEMPQPPKPEYSYAPRPWVRYWARLFDNLLYSIVMGFTLAIFVYLFVPSLIFLLENRIVIAIILIITWLFVEAFLLSTWGTTVGKWLLGTSVRDTAGNKLSFNAALKRSIQVLVNGQFLRIPIVCLFGMLRSYSQLRGEWGKTSWDMAGGYVVRHKKLNIFGVLIIIIVSLGLFYLLSES